MHPGLYLISTFHYLGSSIMMIKRVNALSGLYIISTKKERFWGCRKVNVSMPFRAYTSFLHEIRPTKLSEVVGCQCPLGLIPHFYKINELYDAGKNAVSMPSRAYTSFLHRPCSWYRNDSGRGVNALSGLYLISTYPFKNLGFMRFPEPVFAGIYQNILTTAVFRAC